MYYDYQRWYDPAIGRFISPDPVRGKLSNPQSLNLYVYVFDLPTSLTDPSGLDACGWDPASWGGCFNNASQAVNNWWGGLSPEQQQLITLAAFAAITFATGGTDLLIVGAIGFGLGAGIYAGATLATGGTPTLRGALFWGTIGFMAATAVASLPTIGPRIMSSLGLGGAEAVGETAAETADTSAFWRTTERGGYDLENTAIHHLLPRQFQAFFGRVLNIDDYTLQLDRGVHMVLHGRGGIYAESWNPLWQRFILQNPNANAAQIMDYLGQLLGDFGF